MKPPHWYGRCLRHEYSDSRSATTGIEDDEIARINALFHEADRLDDIAYRIFDEGCRNPTTFYRFNEAKALADAKRAEAYRAWMHIRRQTKQ